MRVASSAQVRSIDQRATRDFGVPGLLLMENAGARVAAAALELLTGSAGRILILAGKGNNGGDGLVAARHLQSAGAAVTVALLAAAEELKGDAQANYQIDQRSGIDLRSVLDSEALAGLFQPAPALVVDALLGTGAAGAPRGLIAEAIALINGSAAPVLAVDLPSGLDADSGRTAGECVRATRTVTMGCLKPGLLAYPGRSLAGALEVADIGWPLAAITAEGLRQSVTTREEAGACLPSRKPDAHKGDAGHLLVIAGSPGLTGAAVLSSRAALRAGAGLVTLGVPSGQQPVVASLQAEVMTLPLPEADGVLGLSALDPSVEFLARCRALALGPGVGRHSETAELVRRLAVQAAVPVAIDADGLHALSGHLDLLRQAPAPRVLTPHPGEMASLLGTSVEAVQGDRPAAALRAARESGAVVVLKGAPTVVARPDGELRYNPTGSAALATAGSGDVLTGIIGALLAQGVPAWKAAVTGVYLHGRCGDLAAEEVGSIGAIAGDFAERIPHVMDRIREGSRP